MQKSSLLDLVKIEADRVGEFFEIRRVLEGWCASHAAKLAGRSDLDTMKSRLDAMRTLAVNAIVAHMDFIEGKLGEGIADLSSLDGADSAG